MGDLPEPGGGDGPTRALPASKARWSGPRSEASPSTGKPAMIACGCVTGPMTAAQTASNVLFVFSFSHERCPAG